MTPNISNGNGNGNGNDNGNKSGQKVVVDWWSVSGLSAAWHLLANTDDNDFQVELLWKPRSV
jgi:hypothetical protein